MYEGQPVAHRARRDARGRRGSGAAWCSVDLSARDASDVFLGATTVTPKDADAKNGYAFAKLDTAKGAFDEAWTAAVARVDATYDGAQRHHNPMEPSATLAEWRGDELHVHDATQWTLGIRYALAAMLGIEPSRIHVRCPYTGGGFGARATSGRTSCSPLPRPNRGAAGEAQSRSSRACTPARATSPKS